jgi:enamine deaminase RidA (YjgF/YER057c/UK114 family)
VALERIFEVYPPQPQATVPLGLRLNDMVYAGGIAGVDPVTSEPAGDLRAQMSAALDHLRVLLERAGGSLDNVARVTGFVTRPEDREPIYEPWDQRFPDPADRPAFKALVATLPAGQLVRLDAVALIGGRRQRIDIPNVPARDPTVKVGNWVFSSRCHGIDPASGELVAGGVEAEARQTLDNLVTLVEMAGGSASSITQITMFGHDESYIEPARRVFEQRFPDSSARPALYPLVNVVTRRFLVVMEMVAVL